MNITQRQAQQRMSEIRDQLKLALHHADFLTRTTIDGANITTFWQITGKAHGMCNSLKSEVGGNEPPKIG